ncbi:MAG: hypothetical protein K2Z81_05575 [Cyanobacteria bacterium]|nr:hypothetical protein [Cyanobacteriota bacterium]
MTNQFEAGNIDSYQSQPAASESLLNCITQEDWRVFDFNGAQKNTQTTNYDQSDVIPVQVSTHPPVHPRNPEPPVTSGSGLDNKTPLDLPHVLTESDGIGDVDPETRALVERWTKMMDDAQIPEGPYRDILTELGKQMLTGEFNQEKIQKMLEAESRRFDAILESGDRNAIRKSQEEYSQFNKALWKIEGALRKEGIVIDFTGRGVSISEPARKQEWTHSLSLDEHGTRQSKRRFHDPAAPGLTALRHDREEVTADAAFTALSDRFRRALAQK